MSQTQGTVIPLWEWVFTPAAKAKATTRLARPKMSGLLRAQIKRNLFGAVTTSVMCGLAYKVFVADVRKQRYAEFYRTYDAEKTFEEMRKKGLFQSC